MSDDGDSLVNPLETLYITRWVVYIFFIYFCFIEINRSPQSSICRWVCSMSASSEWQSRKRIKTNYRYIPKGNMCTMGRVEKCVSVCACVHLKPDRERERVTLQRLNYVISFNKPTYMSGTKDKLPTHRLHSTEPITRTGNTCTPTNYGIADSPKGSPATSSSSVSFLFQNRGRCPDPSWERESCHLPNPSTAIGVCRTV